MKNKKMKGFLVLASCAMFLTGCNPDALWGLGGKWNSLAAGAKGFFDDIALKLGLKKAEQKEEQKEEEKPQEGEGEGQGEGQGEGEGQQEIEVDITLKEFAQPEFEVGDVIDFEELVTLDPVDATFTVQLASDSSQLATVEGHKLTVTGAGTVNFSIKAGKSEKAGSLKAVEMHESRAFMIDYFKNFGHSYTVDMQVYDATTQGLAPKDAIYHSQNYVYEANAGKDDNNQPYGLGFLRFADSDEKAYLFTLQENATTHEEEIELRDKYNIDYLNKYYNPDFPVDFSKISYEYDAEYDEDLYVLTGEDAGDFAEAALFCANGRYGGYDIDRVEFSIWNVAEEGQTPKYQVCAYPTLLVGTERYYVAYCFLSNDAADVGYPFLESYCVPANRPPVKDYFNEFLSNDEYFSSQDSFYGKKLSDLLLSPTGVFGAAGKISLLSSWYNMNDEPVIVSSDATYFGQSLPRGVAYYFTGENSIWDMDPIYDDEYNVTGYTPDSGVVNFSVGDPAETKVYNAFYDSDEDKYSLELDSSRESAWSVLPSDPTDVTLSGLANPAIWSEQTVASCATAKDGDNNDVYRLAIDTAEAHDIVNVLARAFPGLPAALDYVNAGVLASADYDIYDMMSVYMYFIPATKTIEFDCEMSFFSNAYYYFEISMTADESIGTQVAAFETAASAFLPA